MRFAGVFCVAVSAVALALLPHAVGKADDPADKSKRAAAENSACFVCHGNYKTEELASTHSQAGVACADCHGQSIDHCNNEENIIPPQIMYPREKINSACKKCHATHKLALTADPPKVCTDCHGKHRLRLRTKLWDKVTGKLLKSE
jgi:hypothetical protein